jgi:hypothetical protein
MNKRLQTTTPCKYKLLKGPYYTKNNCQVAFSAATAEQNGKPTSAALAEKGVGILDIVPRRSS